MNRVAQPNLLNVNLFARRASVLVFRKPHVYSFLQMASFRDKMEKQYLDFFDLELTSARDFVHLEGPLSIRIGRMEIWS